MLAARDLDAAVDELRAALPLGDTFVEVVSPVEDDTAAGRFLDRHGDGAYMAMFQIDELAEARDRAARLGIREVWSIELDDITACHLHPADIGAAIVSLDRPVPPESWRWAGPWEPHGTATTTGLTLSARDPAGLEARWREVLGTLDLDDGRVEVEQGDTDAIAAFHVSGLPAGEIRAAGATFR